LLLDPENKKLSSEDLEKLVAEEVNLKRLACLELFEK